jgi:hypothetical protein
MGAACTSSYQATPPDWRLLGNASGDRTTDQAKDTIKVGKTRGQTCAWRHLEHCHCQKQEACAAPMTTSQCANTRAAESWAARLAGTFSRPAGRNYLASLAR